MSVNYSTLSANNANVGGGINNTAGSAVVSNSIVANSVAGGECSRIISDGGYNISSDDTCGFDPANNSMPNTNPLLDPLQDNGGPTWTHALQWGSPAIDADFGILFPSTDQRGVPRPRDGDGNIEAIPDIGSYELKGPPVSPNQVTITGPNGGGMGRAHTFFATVRPVLTTLPIEYVWQASGQAPVTHTGGLTDTVSFTWQVTGTQVITVTASNVMGSVLDNHMFTVIVPIDVHLPVVIKSVTEPQASEPASSLKGGGVLVTLVACGVVGRWKRRG